MLLQFIVENFKSFHTEAVLNMAPGAFDDHQDHIIESGEGKKVQALRSAALFGANASGKTNLFEAIQFARDLVVEGTYGEQKIAVVKFKLAKGAEKKPSRFEFIFKHEGVLYHYGILLNNSKILEEWLFATPKKREMKYFERITDESNKVNVSTGTTLAAKSKTKKILELVAATTRPNQPFLKEAFEKNIDEFKPVYRWFQSVLNVIPAVSEYTPLELRAFSDEKFTGFLSSFLRNADTGIDAIHAESTDLDLDENFTDLPVKIREDIRERVKEGKAVVFNYSDRRKYALIRNEQGNVVAISLKARHFLSDTESVDFEIFEESDGTQRLLNILPALADMKNTHNIYIIDELDRRMHTKLTRSVLEYFYSFCGDHENQLIFTTHDTNLLDTELLRRDEVWFIEKNKKGESRLYSLSDFKPRKDLKLNKSYNQGRFGGFPYIKSSLLH